MTTEERIYRLAWRVGQLEAMADAVVFEAEEEARVPERLARRIARLREVLLDTSWEE